MPNKKVNNVSLSINSKLSKDGITERIGKTNKSMIEIGKNNEQ